MKSRATKNKKCSNCSSTRKVTYYFISRKLDLSAVKTTNGAKIAFANLGNLKYHALFAPLRSIEK